MLQEVESEPQYPDPEPEAVNIPMSIPRRDSVPVPVPAPVLVPIISQIRGEERGLTGIEKWDFNVDEYSITEYRALQPLYIPREEKGVFNDIVHTMQQ